MTDREACTLLLAGVSDPVMTRRSVLTATGAACCKRPVLCEKASRRALRSSSLEGRLFQPAPQGYDVYARCLRSLLSGAVLLERQDGPSFSIS